jgi:signal transduction histidine kinase
MSVAASRRWWWVAVAVSVATLTTLVTAELTVDLPRVQNTRNLVLGAGLAAIWMSAGLIAWRARPDSKVGALMVLIGCSHPWNPIAGLAGAYGQWLALMFGSITGVLVLQLALSFPSERLTTAARWAVGSAYVGLLLQAASTGVKPRSDRCPVCPPNPLPTADHRELSDVRWGVAEPFEIVAWGLAAVVLAQRWRRAGAPARRALAPMLWGMLQYAIVIVVLVPLGFLADGRPGTPGFYSLGVIPIGFLIGMLRTRQHHSVVADLVVELRAQPPPDGLRALLARALGDPSLELAFWLPDRRVYVDATGAEVQLAADDGRRVSVLHGDDGEPLAALTYDPALLEDPKLLGAVSAAAQLALENSRLQAELRARLKDVRESRSRLVTATDAERRRIERNLHDGAQQTLIGLRLAVRLARNRAGGDPQALDALLAEIDDELQGAVEELRTLARGVHPAILSDEGLEPALAALARRAAIPTQISCHCARRLPTHVETAAYYVAAEALTNVVKHADATRVRIDVSLAGERAVIEVFDDGRGGADPLGSGLRGLRDRVEALDGTFGISSTAALGTRVRADIPCA